MSQNLEVYLMWSFPLMAFLFGIYSWSNKYFSAMVAFLLIGLALQYFSFNQDLLKLVEHSTGAVIFGRSLLLSFLINVILGLKTASFKDRKERVMLKLMPLTAMSFYTINKFLGIKSAEAIMSIAFLLVIALFWSEIRKLARIKITSLFTIVGISFLSFMLTWSELFKGKFFLNPLLWMIAFTCAFFTLSISEDRI